MISTPKYLVLLICLLAFRPLLAQAEEPDPVKDLKPPKNRELFHDFVDKQQKEILKSDGKADNEFRPSADEEVNFLLTKAATSKVDWVQYRIEKDTALNSQAKIKYLRGLENLLKYFNNNWRRRNVSPMQLPVVIDEYEKCMRADIANEAIDVIIDRLPYDVATNIINAGVFDKNAGYKNSRFILIKKYCAVYPDQTFLKLRANTDVPFLDSLIKLAGYRDPGQLYNFAAANDRLGFAIRKIDDSLVSAISKMATSNSGRWYFPFLDNIMKGKMTIGDIDAVKDDSVKYYRLLVRTHLDYVQRALNKDFPYGYKELEDRIKTKARDVFVNTINALHEVDNPAVRFRIIQPLTAEELYYLAVTTDGIIYTSSFVKGVYPLMMTRAYQRGDSLLMNVRFDKYRKFIKMCAGYNTLSNFLSTFQPKKNPDEESDAERLMRAFVGKLEETGGLEDGVDVADSYASIAETIKPLAEKMLLNIKANYERNLTANNKRGIVMYNLLYKLFLSADTNNHIDLSKEFGIPPVYGVPYKALANDTGRVVMEVIFYGDKDGIGIFQGFKRMFDPKLWKITTTKYWISINSTKGKPVSVYANLPLPEADDQDKIAQDAMDSFLLKNNLYPTVVIHRGHSYNAPYTISRILPSAKIVFMGSCGGYYLIHDILKHSPDAHIITSKQIGKTAVNQPFFNLLMEKVRNGSNIDWIPFWEELEKKIRVEGFEDYIPPYKNLGAIFIKAYKKAMGDEED
ncbi:MAG TPA: hypothetical protein VGQ09_21825 [Chitinophagaceae bacterium]|jgi:hypothetical protein|nr:hypothetical protein [Chitinophagaceae bacterium]